MTIRSFGRTEEAVCKFPVSGAKDETFAKNRKRTKTDCRGGFYTRPKIEHLESYHFKKPKRADVKPAPASPCHEFCKGLRLRRA
ncbi:hypothetical protein D0T90_05825 [Neisseria animalis]|uniref:Uncharacterized protein n=1 Tax=Neisseria animalis TaxID=492 RepID=A0A5P3MR52_NEIAN|nr:hypothetical protein D0T90_05825 [Neisseria animalis]ROW32638.1 hypothetical protein CGZ60_04160 [Neisseria animalis]